MHLRHTHLRAGIVTLLIVAVLAPSMAFAAEIKSPRKAAFLSILLPGLGERYAGGPKSSRFFLFTEGLLWTGLFAFKKLNATRENTFRAYASAHAGATTEKRPTSYYDRLVSYNSIYDYNARLIYVEGEQANPLPDTPLNHWEWNSPEARAKFQDLRSKATWARTRSFLFVGALIFNRFASALNAARIAAKTQPRAAILPTSDGGVQAHLHIQF